MARAKPLRGEPHTLADLIGRYATRDGATASPLAGVRFLRSSRPTTIAATVCKPSVIIVAQGRKQVHLAEDVYTYDARHYLVLSLPLPVHSRVRVATVEHPFLSMQIQIESGELGELLRSMDDGAPVSGQVQPAISVSPVSESLHRAAVRLLQAFADPLDAAILGPSCVREILYRVLGGSQGGCLRALAFRQDQHHRMSRVLSLIHAQFDQPLDIPALAATAHMSVSSFHHAFKAVTSLPPLQYIKSIRLHKSRALMLYGGASASEAAFRVGYRSPSQFSREFRRLFGTPPAEEIARLRSTGEPIDDVVGGTW